MNWVFDTCASQTIGHYKLLIRWWLINTGGASEFEPIDSIIKGMK